MFCRLKLYLYTHTELLNCYLRRWIFCPSIFFVIVVFWNIKCKTIAMDPETSYTLHLILKHKFADLD